MAPTAEAKLLPSKITSETPDSRGDAGVSVYEVAVVGLGLIGSAAARHLSEKLGPKLLAIGPSEPSEGEWSNHDGPFSSHYDQGRLTRISDGDEVWAKLAAQSMARYEALEAESGIKFYKKVGSLRVEPWEGVGGESLRKCYAVAKKHGAAVVMMEDAMRELKGRFKCLGFEHGEAAVMEDGGAGYLNPREMAAAQLLVTAKYGACIVREAVADVEKDGGFGGVHITTARGRSFLAKKVLICAGAYTPFLLPHRRRCALDLRVVGRTVLLAELNELDAAKLQDMTTFIWREPPGGQLTWTYGCPPIRYPNGRVYLKMGGTARDAPVVGTSPELLSTWFRLPSIDNPSKESDTSTSSAEDQLSDFSRVEFKALVNSFNRLFPTVKPVAMHSKQCVVSFTAHGRPYIDAVDEERRVFVATGGCGAAAKSADEIGRLAGLMVTTEEAVWGCSCDINPCVFKAVFSNNG